MKKRKGVESNLQLLNCTHHETSTSTKTATQNGGRHVTIASIPRVLALNVQVFFFFFFLALFWIWPIHFIYSFTNYNLYYYSFIANVFFWDLQRNPFFVFKSQNQPICQILNELAVQNVTRCNRVRLDHDLVPPLTLCIKFFAQSMCKGSTFMTQNWNFGYNNTL